MTLYIAREASKLWRKVCMETSVEIQLLMEKWRLLLAGLVFQYVHGLAARGVHYLHQPGPTLQDLGFMILPELGQERGYISESLFTFVFLTFFVWTFHPFVYHIKRFYTVLLWRRILAFLVASQILRIVTFYSTQLPGPNYHCREGSKLARLPPPESLTEVLLLNFPRGVLYGCGDLIFSSHMIFILVFVRTYHKYGSKRFIKLLAWVTAIIQSLLIVASRKHYTVDVVVAWWVIYASIFFMHFGLVWLTCRLTCLQLKPASSRWFLYKIWVTCWFLVPECDPKNPLNVPGVGNWIMFCFFFACRYTVNLVVFFIDKKLPEMPDRSSGSQPLLPLSAKERDGKSREEHNKLLNGNSVDTADRRQRLQMNGKHGEDGNHIHSESSMNGT